MSEDSLKTWAEAIVEIGQALLVAIKPILETLERIGDAVISSSARAGIAELEMDLKLRDEVGLRTDLLALFDP